MKPVIYLLDFIVIKYYSGKGNLIHLSRQEESP